MQKIKSGIYSFFLGYLIFILALGPALADTASLLPPGVLQLFDNNGNPLSSGYVYTYEVGTSTLKTTWKDSAETTPNTNPIRLDAGGKAVVYGSGIYRTVVKDRNQNLIWDAVTAPGGGGGGTPTLVGDGNLVGTVLPWSGLVAPNQYVFAYGQEISRATYPDFYTAIIQKLNVICSSASNILTGLSDTQSINVGEPVELALCVPPGTTVVSKTSATITLSNPSNVSINTVATFFPWGNGNGSTTFNVPDYRGVVLAGRNNMGGTASSNLTSTYYTSGGLITPNAIGAFGGSQSHTQIIAEMAAHNHGGSTNGGVAFNTNVTIQGTQSTFDNTSIVGVTTGSGNTAILNAFSSQTPTIRFPAASFTISSQGSATPFTIVQPTVTINYIVKITPDTSTSIANGVASLGGMTGVIACGNGLTCTGNIVSATLPVGDALTKTDDTNVTLTLGGSPSTSVLSATSLTLGWTGTLAAARLNSNVVQSVTNETNINGSITAQNLTFAWAGTLSPTRGGCGTSLAATGGTSQVLKQVSVGANCTVGQLAASDLSNSTTGSGAVVLASTPTIAFPTFSGTVAGNNTIPLSILAPSGAYTFLGNPTASTANVSAFKISALSAFGGSPSGTTLIPCEDGGVLNYCTATAIAASATSGVASIGAQTGAFALGVTGTAASATGGGLEVTATPAIRTASVVLAKTANYTLSDADRAKLVTLSSTTPFTITIPQAASSNNFVSGWYIDFQNLNSGAIVLKPTTSTIDGLTSLTVYRGQGVRVFSDGTNYFTQKGQSPPNVVTAEMFGAIADGTTDARTSIQNCINYSANSASSNSPYSVCLLTATTTNAAVFGSTYRVSDGLTFPSGSTLRCVSGNAYDIRIKFDNTASATNLLSLAQVNAVTIENCRIDATSIVAANHNMLALIDSNSSNIRNVVFDAAIDGTPFTRHHTAIFIGQSLQSCACYNNFYGIVSNNASTGVYFDDNANSNTFYSYRYNSDHKTTGANVVGVYDFGGNNNAFYSSIFENVETAISAQAHNVSFFSFGLSIYSPRFENVSTGLTTASGAKQTLLKNPYYQTVSGNVVVDTGNSLIESILEYKLAYVWAGGSISANTTSETQITTAPLNNCPASAEVTATYDANVFQSGLMLSAGNRAGGPYLRIGNLTGSGINPNGQTFVVVCRIRLPT